MRWRGFILMRPWRETRQAWFELRVGGFAMPRTHAAVPHPFRKNVTLLSSESVQRVTRT